MLSEDMPILPPFDSWPGAMIHPQWLEVPMYRTNFCGPKDVELLKFDCIYIYAS